MCYLPLNLTFRKMPSTKGIVKQLLLETFCVFKPHSGLLTKGHLYCVFPGESSHWVQNPLNRQLCFGVCFVLRFFPFCFETETSPKVMAGSAASVWYWLCFCAGSMGQISPAAWVCRWDLCAGPCASVAFCQSRWSGFGPFTPTWGYDFVCWS